MALSIQQKSAYLTIIDATKIFIPIGRRLNRGMSKKFKIKLFKELERLLNEMEEGELEENDIIDSIKSFSEEFGIPFGHAQKAINVVLKYHYYMYEKYLDNRVKIKSILNCPLDSINLKKLGREVPLKDIDEKKYKEIQEIIYNKMHSLGRYKIDFDEAWDIDCLRRRGIEDC